jgi:hypothetical protein
MYEDIKEQFRDVIRASQGIEDPKVDELFSKWEQNKKKFIDRFGGLIFKVPEPVEIALEENEKVSQAIEFADIVTNNFNNIELGDFIQNNANTFFDNRVSKSEDKRIPPGAKLLKVFKFFEKNTVKLKKIQSMASMVIQGGKVRGHLYFSVHPLDYLSSSENGCNWKSCHSLHGEYRAGNLSYMTDKTTFMVYLASEGNTSIPNFGDVEWNSKKWRMLIHASEDDEIIFAGRQYPFKSKEILNLVLEKYNNFFTVKLRANTLQKGENDLWGAVFQDILCEKTYSGWKDDYVDAVCSQTTGDSIDLVTKYIIYNKWLLDLTDIVEQGAGALNYNDILYSSVYQYPYFALKNRAPHSKRKRMRYPIIIGEKASCLECGNHQILDSDTMRCYDCELTFGTEENDRYGHCECCNSRIFLLDSFAVNDDEWVCQQCFDNYCFFCPLCERVFYNEERKYDEDAQTWVCNDCYNAEEE